MPIVLSFHARPAPRLKSIFGTLVAMKEGNLQFLIAFSTNFHFVLI
jgi:hypothetical protein